MIQPSFEWRAYWDEHGTRVDDDKIVPIRVGVIEVDGHLSIAISVAAAPPVTITGRVVAGLGELLQSAQDEHKMLNRQAQQCRQTVERSPADIANVKQAVAWLDDIDAQLSDIATQVRELRARFPAPPGDADTAPAEHGQASTDDETEGR